MGRYLIGIDAGTQSSKAIVWDAKGKIVAEGRAPLELHVPAPGWAEQEAESWWESTASALKEALTGVAAGEIAALGLAWQRETFVPLAASGKPLRRAILWLDQRAAREAEIARREFGAERFQRLTGKPLDTTPSFSKLFWMREHEPALYRDLALVLDVGGFLSWRLTGKARTCIVGGDSLGLMDLERRTWSQELLDYLGLGEENLPELVSPGDRFGVVSETASKETGLPAGTPVVAAGGDGQVFAMGMNVREPEQLSLTVGTSLVLGVSWPIYRVGPAYRTMAGCVPGTFLLEAVLRAGADIIRWYVRDFAPGQRESEIEREIANIPPGSQGLITLPYWKGRMVPTCEPLARGVTIGWSDYHTQAHFYRSLLEGIAFEVRYMIECLEEELGIAPREIRMGGGGALSPVWRQIMADVTGREIVLSAAESTSLGAAMLAAAGVGIYPSIAEAADGMYRPVERILPRPEAQKQYDEIYRELYRELYPQLAPLLIKIGRKELGG